jgi:methylmalonyl-CoA mutase
MNKFLFSEFEPVSAKQWKQKIQFDLRGADYNESLMWQSAEGINVKPFYHRDDFTKEFQPIPGHPPKWNIAQNVFIDDEIIANGLSRDAINRGAEAIIFSAEKKFDPLVVFKSFPFEGAIIYFKLEFLSEAFILRLKQFFSQKNVVVYFNIDIIGNLARSGNWFQNLKHDHSQLESILRNSNSEKIISADLSLYQNAGANMVQQLAYALAHVHEYLNHGF